MMINTLIEYLEELYPNAKCGLKYNKDYELLIAVVMSAQTTDKKVNEVNEALFTKYDTLEKLSKADILDIENIIKKIGTHKKKSIYIKEIATKLLNDKTTKVPNDRTYLESLPGVGRKTANVFLSVIYNEPLLAVDTHVSRISKRLKIANESDTPLEIEQKLMKKLPKELWVKMHHRLIFFGRNKCKSINPDCRDCKLKSYCSYYKQRKISK